MTSKLIHDPALDYEFVRSKVRSVASDASQVIHVERAPTANESMQRFFAAAQNAGPCVIFTNNEGLKVSGRSSLYDLYWIGTTKEMFAVDAKDDAFVATPSKE